MGPGARRAGHLAWVLVLAGCLDDFPSPPADTPDGPSGQDVGLADMIRTLPDLAALDRGPPRDARMVDALAVDARPVDAALTADMAEGPDAVATDAQTTDAQRPDAHARDAESTDAQRTDAEGTDPQPDAEPDACAPAVEICNGLDDDCDGRVDEAIGVGPPCTAGLGRCSRMGQTRCDLELGLPVCDAQPGPAADEVCNGLDDDCDGLVDNLNGLDRPCTEGVGACAAVGRLICAEGPALVCSAVAEAPGFESCNGLDDDCDGQTDEIFVDLGTACGSGLGQCAREGTRICSAGGQGTRCDAEAGAPQPERCNGLDDNCDGLIDEAFRGLGTACVDGVGACRQDGRLTCTADGAGVACDPPPGPPSVERCNGIDDDCDGAMDEDTGLGAPCEVGVGRCARPSTLICDAAGDTTCAVRAGQPQLETCDGTDEDCDGRIDEDFGIGERCTAGVGACRREGTVRCVGNAGVCDAVGGAPADEQCNDQDDNCDGRIDEGAICAEEAVQHCQIWLGQADLNGVPAEPAPTWGDCPGVNQDWDGDVRCVASVGDRLFHALPVAGDVDDNDVLGVAWTCAGSAVPTLDDWVAQHCEIFLGHSDRGGTLAVNALNPDDCTDRVAAGDEPNPRCVRTGGDSLFHPMWLRGDVNADDVFGVALRCADPARPDRAAGLQQALTATLGWHYRDQGAVFECSAIAPPIMDDVADWSGCPADGTDESGTRRCATGRADGGFRAFVIGDAHDVRTCSTLGIALRRRP